MSMSKHLRGVPPRVDIIGGDPPEHLDFMVKIRMANCVAVLPYVCGVFPTEEITFDWARAQIRVKLPTDSWYTFLSIVEYDKHRVTMACVKESCPGEPYVIAELADTPMECADFEEMVGHMLFHIIQIKLGKADLNVEWYD